MPHPSYLTSESNEVSCVFSKVKLSLEVFIRPGESQVLEQSSPRPGSRKNHSCHTVAFWVHTRLRRA